MSYHLPPAWRDLRLGIFFLISLAIFVYSLLVVGTNQHIFERTYDLKLYMGNAQGLARGGMVSLSGLEVGRVKDIEFADKDTANVLEVILSLNKKHRDRITASSVATIRTVGVLGDKFVDISLGDFNQPPLPENSALPVRGEIDWTATLERAANAVDDFVAMTDNAATALAAMNEGDGLVGALLHDRELAVAFREASDNLAAVTGKLRGGDGTLSQLLSDDAAYNKLDAVLDRLEAVVAAADTGQGALARILTDRELGDRIDNLIAGSDSLVTAIRTQGTTGRLVEDEALYDDMSKTLEELKALMEDIRKNPRKYFKVSVF